MVPTSVILHIYLKRVTYSKERAMKVWEERIEEFNKNYDIIHQKKVIRSTSDSLK